MSRILSKIGCIYGQLGQYEQALKVFHEVIESYYHNSEYKEECIDVWISLADTYKELHACSVDVITPESED